MVKWIFNNIYLENKELLFIVSVIVLITIIALTFYFVGKELKNESS